jgi:cytochrome c biogenesis protein CcdA
MTVTTAIVTGVVVGLQHSLETDHLAAISTLVSEDKTDHPGVVGASWGVGHSIPIVTVGLVFVSLSASLPESVATLFEVLAGAILVYLGLRMLLGVVGLLSVERHTHDEHRHTHVSLGRFSFGSHHTHVDGESFVVGIVHGLAGSGAIVVALATSASTVTSSLSLLVSFSAITVLTMGALSFFWGNVLTTRLQSVLELVAGSASVVIGLGLVVDVLLDVEGVAL